jgi:hypothetical protein
LVASLLALSPLVAAAQQHPIAPASATASNTPSAGARNAVTSGAEQGNPIASAQGQSLAKRAIVAVDSQSSVHLQLRQRINMFGQQLVGNGVYQQSGQGEERRLRLDLKVNVANQSTSMQQVCSGRFLYIRRDFGSTNHLGRVDLRRIREAVDQAPTTDGNLDVSQQWMLLGGMPQLLARLEKNFQFTAPEQAMLENTPVLVVDGYWQPQALLALLPEHQDAINAGKPIDAKALSGQLPTQIRLVVRRTDNFPLRIEYLRSGKAAEPNQPPPLTTIMAMEFYDIRTGGHIDPLTFVYNPGNQEVADHTDVYLRSLGLKETRQATREEQPPR